MWKTIFRSCAAAWLKSETTFKLPGIRNFHLEAGLLTSFSAPRCTREFAFPQGIWDVIPEGSDQPTTASFESFWKRVDEVADFNMVNDVLQEWIKEGNVVSKEDVYKMLVRLHSQAHYRKGLKVACWVNREKPYVLTDSDHMFCLEFAAAEKDLKRARHAFNRIEKKTEMSYIILLQLYVIMANVSGAEKVMEEMRQSKIITSPHAYNLMMSIYFRAERPEKALEMLAELQEVGLEADVFTYFTMMRKKEQLQDFDGLEALAEAALQKEESKTSQHTTLVNCCMMKLYAALGKEKDVERIWSNMRSSRVLSLGTHLHVLEAYDLLKNVEKLEEACKDMEMLCPEKKMIRMQCVLMIRAYSRMGLMEKAEKMVEKMEELGHVVGYQPYHHLIASYLKKNENKKAIELFNKSVAEGCHYPYSMAVLIMKGYEETADVKGAEELFKSFSKDTKMFNGLLKVYLNAKVVAYGMESRMGVLQIIPDVQTTELLHQISLLNESVN